jgi:hypothetical protein
MLLVAMTGRRSIAIAFGLLAVGLAIQLVPYGRAHSNPPVTAEPEWSDPRTRELFFRACGDCHSNETEWPWYSAVAPASWLVRWDVDGARSHFNVSEWGREHNHGDDAAEMVRAGEMPLWRYLLLHPEARLSETEREELIAGLEATFVETSPGAGAQAAQSGRGGHHDHGEASGEHEH